MRILYELYLESFKPLDLHKFEVQIKENKKREHLYIPQARGGPMLIWLGAVAPGQIQKYQKVEWALAPWLK